MAVPQSHLVLFELHYPVWTLNYNTCVYGHVSILPSTIVVYACAPAMAATTCIEQSSESARAIYM